MTKLDDLITAFDQCINTNEDFLKVVRRRMDKVTRYQFLCSVANTFGSVISVGSYACFVSLPLIPRTKPFAFITAAQICAVGVGTTIAINAITDIITDFQITWYQRELGNQGKLRKPESDQLASLMDEVEKSVKKFESAGQDQGEAWSNALVILDGQPSTKGYLTEPEPASVASSKVPTLEDNSHGFSTEVSGHQIGKGLVQAFMYLVVPGVRLYLRPSTDKWSLAMVCFSLFVVAESSFIVSEWTRPNSALEHGKKLMKRLEQQIRQYSEIHGDLARFKINNNTPSISS